MSTTTFEFPSTPLGLAPLNTPSHNDNNDLNPGRTYQYTTYDGSPLNTHHDGSPLPSNHRHQPATPSFMPRVPIIDVLAVDNIVKEFDLEPGQRANIHAFVQVWPSSPIDLSTLIRHAI